MTGTEGSRSVVILLAEDNPADVRMVREVLRSSKMGSEVHSVRDGVETMQFLRREGPFALAPRAELVLLDLNMPRKDGRQVLVELKGDRNLRRIPVVVLTSSPAEEDLLLAYDSHANCYIRKPMDFVRYQSVVERIENFWFSVVELPPS